MRSSIRSFLIVLTCFVGLTAPRVLHACTVCVELPKASIADHVLAAEVIVLAGPTSGNPFKFSIRRVLKGSDDRLKEIPEIPFLVDSVTRRAFRSDPTNTVLFTYGATRTDRAGRSFSRGWKRIFTMTPERKEFIGKLRSVGQLWTYGETDSSDRISFFSDYLWHSDHVLHSTALVEIGRAPYDLVRPIGDRVSTNQILEELNRLDRFVYRPTVIRLLGLQSDTHARSIVRQRYIKALNNGGLNAFEWALAGIEADGALAIKSIDLVLQGNQMTDDDKWAFVRALTEAGSSQPRFRGEIIAILLTVLERDRTLAARIAFATRNWGKTPLHQQFKAIADHELTDPATEFVLNMVLDQEVAVE